MGINGNISLKVEDQGPARVNILGVGVSAIDLPSTLTQFKVFIKKKGLDNLITF